MNILMISGSPRKNGNTARILERICAELPWANTEICYLPNLQLNGCLGCSHCQHPRLAATEECLLAAMPLNLKRIAKAIIFSVPN